MQVLTKYKSDDGREFLDLSKCIAYEALCKEIGEIMSQLVPIPDLPSCSFQNGAGYIQQDKNTVTFVKLALLKIANTIFPHTWFQQELDGKDVHPSWAGRLIGDMDEICVRSAWYRISCIDCVAREYGQPYYASNHCSDQRPNVCLNPKAQS